MNTEPKTFTTAQDLGNVCKGCKQAHEASERRAYAAGLADGQDEVYSQAAPVDETPAVACICAAQYLGQNFHTDPCPLNVAPAADPEPVRVGRTVHTSTDRIPSYAVLVDEVELGWIPGIRRATVTTAQDDDRDFGLTIWVYAQHQGAGRAELLYMGRNLNEARRIRDAYVAGHTNQVATMARDAGGARPSEPKLNIFNAPAAVVVGPLHFKAPAPVRPVAPTPEPELDPRTGLPLVEVDGLRYVVGLRQCDASGSAYVDFWQQSSRTGMVAIRRAYADARPGTTHRVVWDAQHALRNA